MKNHSYLKRLHNYTNDNPLYGWLICVGIMLVFDAALLWIVPSMRKPALVGLLICYLLAAPTMHLVRRFSTQERAENPVSPKQEQAVGFLALFAALFSVLSFSIVMFSKRIGLLLSTNAAMILLFGYAVLLLLALGFGVAAQHTKAGLLGFRIAAGFFFILIVLATFCVSSGF